MALQELDRLPGPSRERSVPRRPRGGMLIGSTVVAAVAYIDPGNFATNTVAGSALGYQLVWVLVAASLSAMLIQFLAAKLGLVTGAGLPELCRRHLPRGLTRTLWVQAELVCIATDVAEIIGGAVALYLLFGMSPLMGGLITAAVSLAILALAPNRRRSFESVVATLFAIVVVAFVYQVAVVGVDGSQMMSGLVPRLANSGAAVIAAGIVGATVMPHVIYLHSSLTADVARQPRLTTSVRRLLRDQRRDIVLALGIAGAVNLLIMVVAAQTLGGAVGESASIQGAFGYLLAVAGPVSAAAFAVALLASSIASSSVGTLAGEVVMAGFLGMSIPPLLRRLVTVTPALLVLASGVDPTQALLWSQVILAFGIPFAAMPLLWFTSRTSVMGSFANSRLTIVVASALAVLVTLMSAVIVRDAFSITL